MANPNTAKDGESAVLAAIGATRSCGAMGERLHVVIKAAARPTCLRRRRTGCPPTPKTATSSASFELREVQRAIHDRTAVDAAKIAKLAKKAVSE
jgi:hypothetical protein